ncbi:hypothetical protein [Streptomyces sp. NPDC091215]|uniref:hypothetical protein n=1 Tax=Streptomyces sp. NPDC091215 TaxID=3155192 RepID=UPI0034155B47
MRRWGTGRRSWTLSRRGTGSASTPRTRRRFRCGIHPDTVGFRIGVPPVDATQRAATGAVLRAQALPQLHGWITRGMAAGETWHLTPHQHYWRLTDGHLTHRDEA